ncbi:CRISPR-associated helicase/endonuclease Cas3 [Desulfovibrio litoralis]|uniref:CRISPR-associated endonuclease/helicase Cas3 n=1 Tax=Desulfovibrio litoralis DSM 11393 TaxID=1121455 RepID=A0A1M7TRD0_9BACT|nr:CRISPR-associated helicase/endonuclease Cas3 [Desulfovibrio litoralis]SHN73226.1 CRISPR-associated endonuclease/helicase Cas3 [Desulfovibrio litoralis DSM 11393]
MTHSYLAHSENRDGNTHLLKDHLTNTQKLIKTFANNKTQEKMLSLVALLHDLGKYQEEFQAYLKNGGQRGSVPHARWGAIVARQLDCHELSFCINGHHKGLENSIAWEKEDTVVDVDKGEDKKWQELYKLFLTDMSIRHKEFVQALRDLLAELKACSYNKLERELLTRFIFSCLTDADWLDTESHFSPDKAELRGGKKLDLENCLKQIEAIFQGFESHQASLKEINVLRNQARKQALEKANGKVDFYSLNLPTGLGKTLTSFHWALEHARANKLKRIIIVLPYVNIIDQTAALLKKYFGEDNILEHHASFNEENKEETKSINEETDKKKLACENWDYPIIVTTTVQFYESLFSNKPSKSRKIHNIANSVVILDEVQTLSKELVLPTLDMLKDVQKVMNTSFVFCTATMPAFEKHENFNGVERLIPLVDNAEELFNKTKRVNFNLLNELNPLSIDDLKTQVILTGERGKSTLVIFNTKQITKDFYLSLSVMKNWEKSYHLSTNMCPVHRKAVIENIRADLKNKVKILVVSTQLIEAGVDFDFPCVFRAIAPLESIIQAAGRCNREGSMAQKGEVYLFELENAIYPSGAYKTEMELAKLLIKDNVQRLDEYSFFKNYYQQVMSLYIETKKITPVREAYDFEKVNSMYKLIDNATQSIFIYQYNDESKELYRKIEEKQSLGLKPSRSDFRKLQVYSVQVYPNFFQKTKGLYREINGVIVWDGKYNETLGLDIDNQNLETLFV